MTNKKKLGLIKTDLKVFYVPYTRTDADLFEVRAKSIEHAIQKFNFIMSKGRSPLNPCRRVSLIEKQANIAYKKGYEPDAVGIFNRIIDFYNIYDREIIYPPHLKEVN